MGNISTDLIVTILVATVIPLLTVIVSSYFMRKSGMMPAQQRLDDVLKTTVDALQIRIQNNETQIVELKAQLKSMQDQHKLEMQVKEAAILALQTALSREQLLNDQLRVQLVEANQKIAGIVAIQLKEHQENARP